MADTTFSFMFWDKLFLGDYLLPRPMIIYGFIYTSFTFSSFYTFNNFISIYTFFGSSFTAY